ncbi:macro domain-containing protein [Butyrivibrio sp. MB2005]|uniref:macro domain-containing protein n=1 Tax=Butyrivibrio sp. MB2005 TaxID=1280678 RepID=UPI000404208E|nr:macro domain-containing protein [Butyrivibrio sp. MB2005]
MPFSIIRNDITKIKADAIVNTANPAVAIGDGVDAAIYKAAGEEKLLNARREIGVLNPGEVGITPAFDLDAKYIIHASGPWWEGGDHGEAQLLRQCYDRSLMLAAENGCESIAFPLLATGTYGFPKELGIQIAIDAFTQFLLSHEMEITLVVFGEYAYHISGKIFDDVKSYIDEEYVSAALEDEYYYDGIPEGHYGPSDRESGRRGFLLNTIEAMASAMPFSAKEASKKKESFGDFEDMMLGAGAEKTQLPNEDFKAETEKTPAPNEDFEFEAEEAEDEECECEMMFLAKEEEPQSLDDALKGMYTDSFEKHLQQLINKKGLKNSEIYTAANISKQYFSKLLKGQVKPSKEKVLSLAVGLRLNLDETVDFLKLAGYALSPISQTDVVVKYFIVRGDYSVMKIDIALFDYGLEPLSKG